MSMNHPTPSQRQSPPRVSTVLLWILALALFAAVPGLGAVLAWSLGQPVILAGALTAVAWWRWKHPTPRHQQQHAAH